MGEGVKDSGVGVRVWRDSGVWVCEGAKLIPAMPEIKCGVAHPYSL